MPIFYQQEIDATTKIAIWHIKENEDFFLSQVPLSRHITHPHKRLQHLAGRFLLKHLFPDFPIELIKIADTRKPFLEDEAYHFSISHCADYAAVIVSKQYRVGVDIERVNDKVMKIYAKFSNESERNEIANISDPAPRLATQLWSAKEAMFKWWGSGNVSFSDMLHVEDLTSSQGGKMKGKFIAENVVADFPIAYQWFEELVLAYVVTDPAAMKSGL